MRKLNVGLRVSVHVLLITLILLVFVIGSVANASPKISWKWNFYPMSMEEEPAAKALATQVIPNVKKRTNGSFIIKAYWGPELGIKPFNYPQAIAGGAIEMAWSFPGYYAGTMPIIQVNGLPMFISSMKEYKVLSDTSRNYFLKAYRGAYKGAIELLAVGPYNWAELVTTKPMSSITDWSGMKIRVPDKLGIEFVNKMGGVGLTTTWAEMVPALHQGVVTGVATAFESMTKAKLYEVCNHVYLINMAVGEHHVFGASKALASLPDEYRNILLEELAKTESYNWNKVIPLNPSHKEAIDTWSKHGATITEMTPADLKKLRERAQPLWKKWNESIGGAATELLNEFFVRTGQQERF